MIVLIPVCVKMINNFLFFCRRPECENTEAYLRWNVRLIKVISPIVIKFLVVSLISIQYSFFYIIILRQTFWIFINSLWFCASSGHVFCIQSSVLLFYTLWFMYCIPVALFLGPCLLEKTTINVSQKYQLESLNWSCHLGFTNIVNF